MTFSKPPPRVKQWDGDKLPTARPTRKGTNPLPMFAKPTAPPNPPARPMLKTHDRSKAMRESARGEGCTVRYTGICVGGTEATIWSHARWGAQLGDAGRSGARKALDICGAYACTACDAAYDGQARAPHLTREQLDLDWCMGHLRSLAILKQKGLI